MKIKKKSIRIGMLDASSWVPWKYKDFTQVEDIDDEERIEDEQDCDDAYDPYDGDRD